MNIPHSQGHWGRYVAPLVVVTLAVSYQCQAQCSTPSAALTAANKTRLLYSPGYPEEYPYNTDCSWNIRGPIQSARIQLTVTYRSFACCCGDDHLIIRDGINNEARSIAILCATENPVTMTSSGNVIYGDFHSRDDDSGRGYIIKYSYFDSELMCPAGWIERDGYCYKLYGDLLRWGEAASRCGYDGGFLVSIDSQEENDFILASFQINRSVWIGMNETGIWLDGSLNSYENFRSGQPTTGMCAFMDLTDNGRWDTERCSSVAAQSICKKSKSGIGDRYWTPINTVAAAEGSAVLFIYIAVVFAVVLLILYSGLTKKGLYNCYCVSSAYSGIYKCVASRPCSRCTRCSSESSEDEVSRAGSISSQYGPVEKHTLEESICGDSTQDARSPPSPPSSPQSPPSPAIAGDLPELPPPSFSEALSPQFNMAGTEEGLLR